MVVAYDAATKVYTFVHAEGGMFSACLAETEHPVQDMTVPQDADRSQKFEWTTAATSALLGVLKENDSAGGATCKKKVLWQRIAKSMQKEGYALTPMQVENKHKLLARSFKEHVNDQNTTGNSSKKIPFEDELGEIFRRRHFMKPPVLSGKKGLTIDPITNNRSEAGSSKADGKTSSSSDGKR